MRIGFDVSPLHRPHPRGIERLVRGAMAALDSRGQLEIVRLAPDAAEDLRAWRQGTLPRLSRELELDGIHSFVSAFPWRGRGARVQTVHELPWRHGVRENAGLRHRAWALFGPLRADLVLCGSEFAARDLRRRILPGASKVRVCPWGVGSPFEAEPPAGTIDEAVLGRYRLSEDPLALCLGAVRAKKNLAAVLRGLAEVRRRNGPRIQLVVTGEDTPDLRRDLGLVAQLGLSRWVSTPGPIEERDLPSLLRLASAVPVLSKSEGFSFPVLEALASATPVIVARDSAQAELAGEVGIQVDPDDPSSVADGLVRAVEERELLRPLSSARASAFSWARCAGQLEQLWRELA
jgi:glycosyltransferase involved in cell wall biosynthesis